MKTAAERTFTSHFRSAMADKGKAMPSGSFPILNETDLKNAIRLVGHAKDPAAAKAHIIKRAKALGLTRLLPADWKVSKESVMDETGRFRASDVMTAAEAVFTDQGDGKPPTDFEIVIVRPGESTNRRNYSRAAIKRAVESGFWNGAKMFADHPTDLRMPRKRSINDLVAGINTTRLGPSGEAIGVGRFFKPEFAAFAAEAKDHMGVSIVHEFKGRRMKGADGKVHEEVDDFLVNHSVDWVAFPAAGGGITQFLTATESEEDVDWETLTPEMVQEHAPAVYDSIVETVRESAMTGNEGENDEGGAPKPNDAGAAPITLDDVRKVVSESVAEARKEWETERDQTADAAAKTASLVEKSGLPAKARDRIVAKFTGTSEFVEATVQEAIDDEQAYLKELGVAGPVVKGLGASGVTGESKVDAAAPGSGAPSLGAMSRAFGIKPATTEGAKN